MVARTGWMPVTGTGVAMARAVLPVGAAISLVAGLATAGPPLPSERPLSAQVAAPY